jgi:putative ABC transport system ATP-binding protein
MSDAAIDLADVRFSWPLRRCVLAIRRLTIQPGERVFLHGRSGSGKSTLLGIVGGIFRPQAGSVRILGTALQQLSSGARDRFRGEQMGFIFQMFNLIPYLSVLENVLLPLRFSAARARRLQAADVGSEAHRLLAALGLSEAEILQRQVTELSVGQQQRVAAARALIGRPPILVADEPTSSLDAEVQADFLGLLMTECAAHGTTLLFVSHDSRLAPQFDRIIEIGAINGALA